MKNATMLYQAPGPHQIHGGNFDYKIVDADEVEEALADGWHMTTTDAQASHEADQGEPADNAPPTRKEMLAKAKELGLPHAFNISNVALAELIDAAIAKG